MTDLELGRAAMRAYDAKFDETGIISEAAEAMGAEIRRVARILADNAQHKEPAP